jgi:hypothetical protein
MAIVQCVNFRDNVKGTLLGYADIRFPELLNFIVKDFRYFSKDGKNWASLPAREYEKDGERKYAPTSLFEDKKDNEEMLKKIAAAIADYRLKGAPPCAEDEIPLF